MADPLEEFLGAARAALPPVEGELEVPGLHEPVEVLRDRWGIPYLSAASLDDLWFAQGFVQASERLFQIELALRAAGGRLSGWFSDLTIAADRFARTVGFHRIGVHEARRWSDASRSMMRRFVDGARAWVGAMPAPPLEYAMLGVAPDLPEDLETWAAAFAYLAWGLSGNWDDELLRLRLSERFGAETAAALLPPAADPTGIAAGSLAGRLLDGLPRSSGQGSNNWVVSGSRTASGRPLLANDPHLLVQQPAAWFELHLRAPGFEARGVALPFVPGILIGTTPHHAWGVTNVSGDVQDLYVERLNDEGTAAEFDGGWEPMTVHAETIEVRGGPAVTFDVRETRHGPILETAPVGVSGNEYARVDGTFALRWTAADGLLEPVVLADLVRAASFEGFREALRGLWCPGQNVVYADVEGTIGYQCTGRFPVRRAGDGSAPVAGWTSDHEWEGYLPYEELPWSKDPGTGFVVTANHRIHDDDYPHLIGLDFHTGFRARRIADLLEPNHAQTAADSAAIQVDTVSLPAQRLLPHLLAAEARSDAARRALGLLEGWSGDLEAGVGGRGRLRGVGRHDRGGRVRRRGGDRSLIDEYVAWREAFVCTALPAMLDGGTPPPGGGSWDEVLAVALDEAVALLAERFGRRRARVAVGRACTGFGSRTRSRACRGSARCSSRPTTSSAGTSRPSCRAGSTRGWGSTRWWFPRGGWSWISRTPTGRSRCSPPGSPATQRPRTGTTSRSCGHRGGSGRAP